MKWSWPNVRYYLGIYMDEMRKIIKDLGKDTRFQGQDLIPRTFRIENWFQSTFSLLQMLKMITSVMTVSKECATAFWLVFDLLLDHWTSVQIKLSSHPLCDMYWWHYASRSHIWVRVDCWVTSLCIAQVSFTFDWARVTNTEKWNCVDE
jgi:hypothetical protein